SQILIGGSGASSGGDGVDVIETDATSCMNIPAEALELEAPIRVHRASLAPDSGGAGGRRGGRGAWLGDEIRDGGMTSPSGAASPSTRRTSGGAAFGDPRQRPRAAVRADIGTGKVSAQAAEQIYGFE